MGVRYLEYFWLVKRHSIQIILFPQESRCLLLSFLLARFAMIAIVVLSSQEGGLTMATLNISMPDELRAFVQSRVNTGEYQSASDYLRDLIRHDREEIERLLVEGLESGKAIPLDLSAMKKKAQAALEKEQGL
jgi:antitoxin ParD1/3/4